ncbi:hypothetical protein niasHS_016334 [Heterodera schachtii]|uniref:BED-type domain-containing protein n=1 Tax=Heterodera schachtii TaxID=97005 RepID=A0ABD2HTE8_HETSC
MHSKASDIWNFFIKISTEVAKCRLCENQLACKQACTKGLWGHFKAKHAKEYENYLQKADPLNGITKFFGKEDPQKKADEQIARLMIRTNCSFLFVEAPELQNLFSLAYPKLQLHRRDYFRRHVIPRMADEIQQKNCSVNWSGFFSVTSDGWSQITKSPALLSVTVHHINEQCEQADFVLDVIPMTNHTGVDITEEIGNTLRTNGLNPEKVICLVRDNAKNMIRDTNILNLNSFQCVCHFLHLVMGDVLGLHRTHFQDSRLGYIFSYKQAKDWKLMETYFPVGMKMLAVFPNCQNLQKWYTAFLLHQSVLKDCSQKLDIYANSLRNRLSGNTVRQILIVKANLDALLLAPTNEFNQMMKSSEQSAKSCALLDKHAPGAPFTSRSAHPAYSVHIGHQSLFLTSCQSEARSDEIQTYFYQL